MRATAAVGLAAFLLCFWPETAAHSNPAQCASSDAIGVSRVVEIDTASGPRFGQLQYKDIDFLRDGEVVLTFDDGPLRRHSRAVLDALDAHCTKATFFIVGRMAISDPETLQDLIVGARADASKQVTILAQTRLGPLAGGLGGFGIPGT